MKKWLIGCSFFIFIPLIAGVVGLVFLAFAIFGGIFIMSDNATESAIETDYGMLCVPEKQLDIEAWNDTFQKGGVFKNKAKKFRDVANKKGIDPVLFASIAFFETGYGTSDAVKKYNNPGGLMDPDTGSEELYEFPTLDKGIEAMGDTLYRRIIVDGLNTIEKLGKVYAPIGAKNDPDGLNKNWVPGVKKITSEFGGLIMSCEFENVDGVDIKGDYAWIVPFTTYITSPFGHRNVEGGSSYHQGIDIAENGINNTPVVSMADGTVIESGINGTTFVSSRDNMGSGFGYYIVIDHGDGLTTTYAHLIGPGIPVGREVEKGELIGRVGSTGASTGPHLHFEIRQDGVAVDPEEVLSDFLD